MEICLLSELCPLQVLDEVDEEAEDMTLLHPARIPIEDPLGSGDSGPQFEGEAEKNDGPANMALPRPKMTAIQSSVLVVELRTEFASSQ
jgi:hypothetical protein